MPVLGVVVDPRWPQKDKVAQSMVEEALAPLDPRTHYLLVWTAGGRFDQIQENSRFVTAYFSPKVPPVLAPQELGGVTPAPGAGWRAHTNHSHKTMGLVSAAFFVGAVDAVLAFWAPRDQEDSYTKLLRQIKQLKAPMRITYPNPLVQLVREDSSGL